MKNNKSPFARGLFFRRHLTFIVLLYTCGLGITLFIYLLVPKYYRTTASVLQPVDTDISTGSKFSEDLVSHPRSNTQLFFSILGSERMQDDIITRFDLTKTYNARNVDETREILTRRTRISLSNNKVIQVEVIDRSPERASEMANFYLTNLEALIKELNITTAKQNRVFIEKRLEETTQLIGGLEAKLTGIQKAHRLVADKQLDQLTRNAGLLMENLLNKQLELEKKRFYLSETDPEIVLLKKEIAEIKTLLSHLLDSQDELSRILRELTVQESIYSLLTTKLEEAKINETRDTPVVQILDRGSVPDKIYKPNIKLITGVVSIVLSIISFLILFFDILRYLGSI